MHCRWQKLEPSTGNSAIKWENCWASTLFPCRQNLLIKLSYIIKQTTYFGNSVFWGLDMAKKPELPVCMTKLFFIKGQLFENFLCIKKNRGKLPLWVFMPKALAAGKSESWQVIHWYGIWSLLRKHSWYLFAWSTSRTILICLQATNVQKVHFGPQVENFHY